MMLSHWSERYRKPALPLNFGVLPSIHFLNYLNEFDLVLLHPTKQSKEPSDED